MKNLLIALTILFTTNIVLADSWDNLTKEQAESLVRELELNPYIFDYCDCCDHEGVYAAKVRLLKVVKTEIIPCPWESESFSVNVETKVLAHVPYMENGPDLTKMTSKKKETAIYTVAMNYTWSYNEGQKSAAPLFTTVPYDKYDGDKKACKAYFKFPTPEQGKGIIKDGKYKSWYKKRFGK
jgi:hypothetical protein